MAQIPEGFIIPDFGDQPQSTTLGAATHTASGSGAPSYSGPRKLAIICSKGNLDMAYPGLIVGNSALSEGVEVHLFFTFWGLDIVNKKTMDNLKFTLSGNTAMHMPELGRLKPGLEHMSIPQALGNLPGMTSFATKMMKRQMDELEIPPIREFLDLMEAAGANMWACRLSFDMMKMIEADLHSGVQGVISAGEFIELSDGAQLMFV